MKREERMSVAYEAPQVEVVEVEKGFAVSGVPAFTPFGGDGGEQDWG